MALKQFSFKGGYTPGTPERVKALNLGSGTGGRKGRSGGRAGSRRFNLSNVIKVK